MLYDPDNDSEQTENLNAIGFKMLFSQKEINAYIVFNYTTVLYNILYSINDNKYLAGREHL